MCENRKVITCIMPATRHAFLIQMISGSFIFEEATEEKAYESINSNWLIRSKTIVSV